MAVECLNGAEEVKDEEQDTQQEGDGELPPAIEPERQGDHQHRAQTAHQIEGPHPGGLTLLELDADLAAPGEIFGELLGTLSQQVEGLGNTNALHIVQHCPCESLALLLSDIRVSQGAPQGSAAQLPNDPYHHQGGQSQPGIQEGQPQHKNGLGKGIAHHVGNVVHTVLLNEHHVGGQNGTDFADVALCEIAHGQAAQMPSQLHAQIGEYHIARRGLEPVGDVLAQALQQNAAHRAHRQPQAQPCRHGSLEKSAQGQEGQTDGGLGQHGLQERKDKGQLDPPLIGAGYGQDSFHQRDHASSPPFSAETRQAAAPSAARHSFS